jgi:pyruvate/2-oxoglutarate dehydrogenase complex dihydrolipoamide dehydrogenase (E3) component
MAEVWAPDICVIGGGPGGIALALGAAALGVPVVLVEKGQMGGSDLLTGSIPSKAFLFAASHHELLRRAPVLGVSGAPLQVSFAKIREHVASVEASVAPSLSAERLNALGVNVISAPAAFTGRRTVIAGDITIRARRFVVATGAVPAPPDLPGLDSVDYMTADAAFDVVRKPSHLLILGADPRGLEVAQAYARLGVDTTVIDTAKALADDDPELARIVLDRLQAEGVRVRDGVTIVGIGRRKGGIRVTLVDQGEEIPVDGSHLLVMSGRAPNVEGLDLPAAGVAFDTAGVQVDDRLRTSNRRIFAAGDICSPFKFTHAADAMARIVIRNALFFGRARASALVIPWCTYTDPEVAHVGWQADAARRHGHRVETITIPLDEVDRAVVDEDRDGFVRVHHERGRLLGCTVVSSRAGEMIGVATHALTHGASLSDLGSTIHPYPTLNNAFGAAGDAYARTRLTPRLRRVLKRYFRLFEV